MTPEQTALIPIYRQKWRQIGLSIKPIDRPQATAAINTAYNIIGCREPEIIFCDHEFLDGTRHVIYPWNQSKI